MTFYWWSHWFWITVLSSFALTTFVQTYPSQELKNEYNQNSKTSVTKLFQASTSWATTAPTSTQIMDLTQGAAAAVVNSTPENVEDTNFDYEKVEALEIASGKNEIRKPKDDATYMDEKSEDYEVKRSAEILDSNRTHKLANLQLETIKKPINSNETHVKSAIKNPTINKKPKITIAEIDSLESKQRNDNEEIAVENFKFNFSNLSTNATNNGNMTTSVTPVAITTNTSESIAPSAPATPHIDSESAAAEWLHTAVLPAAAVSQPNIEEIASNLVTVASASQRVPFTLENVNKEDELRRAETEHRTRKSKVLSGDYKQINRYINYSSDPKSLLARSASTAPNEFNGDNESNISSEALAIQRTYFLDAGAISAICFTVFGVCCTVGTIGIVLYRRRYLNKPQTLSEPDSSVYIDDSTMRVSDNSDEMYSLDNDSFLNSLEAMTIQNYWTDTVKHTKL